MHGYMDACTHVRMYACTHGMHACMHACMDVYMYVLVGMYGTMYVGRYVCIHLKQRPLGLISIGLRLTFAVFHGFSFREVRALCVNAFLASVLQFKVRNQWPKRIFPA